MDKKTIGLFLKRNSQYLHYLLDKYAFYIYSKNKNIKLLKSKASKNDSKAIDQLNYKFLLCIRYDEIKNIGVNKNYVFFITYDNYRINIILERSNLLKSELFYERISINKIAY